MRCTKLRFPFTVKQLKQALEGLDDNSIVEFDNLCDSWYDAAGIVVNNKADEAVIEFFPKEGFYSKYV